MKSALLAAFSVLLAATPLLTQQPVTITVHAAKSAGNYTPIWGFFGADEPNFTTAANGQKLLHELGALSSTPVYFRPHNLFTTGSGEGSLKWGSTNVYTEKSDGTPVYDWTITDRIFDALNSAHVRPLVEIGFMPEALSTHPEPYRHNFPSGDVYTGWSYPPKDWEKWGKLVEAYTAHLKSRYGAEVDTWLWEIWNEPDIAYWHGTPEEYDRLYDVSTAAIRSVLPRARVGGPESTGVGSAKAEAFLRQFLEHCAHGKNAATGGIGAPLDFISWHPKGRPTNVADANGGSHVRMDIGVQLRAMDRGMRVVASYPEWKKTPIIFGESDPEGCAACKGPANGYRNGPLYGVSVAEATIRAGELAQRYGVHMEGAVTWAFEMEDQPAFAGFRELATNGVDKPVLNVFRMMAMLHGNWLTTESSAGLSLDDVVQGRAAESSDINAVATVGESKGRHEVNILVWNYHDEDLPAKEAAVELHIDGLTSAAVDVSEYRMDATHSNAYTAWQKMGSPPHLTADQHKQLEEAGALETTNMQKAVAVSRDAMELKLALPRQGVELVRLSW